MNSIPSIVDNADELRRELLHRQKILLELSPRPSVEHEEYTISENNELLRQELLRHKEFAISNTNPLIYGSWMNPDSTIFGSYITL